jgi:hypothetical protein
MNGGTAGNTLSGTFGTAGCVVTNTNDPGACPGSSGFTIER